MNRTRFEQDFRAGTYGMVNVVISHDLKFVYLGIPRTASRATHAALKTLSGAFQHGLLHEMGIPDECESYFTFCCVRNPYRRFLSWYRWRNQPHPWGSPAKDMNFEQYIEATEAGKLGPSTVREFTLENRLDHIYRFEDLPNSLLSLTQIQGIESMKHLKCGQKLSRHWQKFYNQGLADRVYKICKSDFDEFGYDRESWRQEVRAF